MLHYTGMANGPDALAVLRNPDRFRYEDEFDLDADGNVVGKTRREIPRTRVSCHYLVEEDGRVFRLVDDSQRAWHAGAGSWDGETDVNSASIGIEIVNGGHDFGLPPYPEAQIRAVAALVRLLLDRHGLDRHHVIGHSDLAPSRKADPGERFPWRRLAEAGLSIWPPAGPEDGDRRVLFDTEGTRDAGIAAVQAGLATIGYGIAVNGVYDAPTRIVTRAFQRRFRQDKTDGAIDVETVALVGRVARLLRP